MPRHVAVIMDGNRRWARARRLPVAEGYRRGMTALRELTRSCRELGIPFLTAYGFSTENWKRDPGEISLLFDMCCAFARNESAGLRREGVRVRVLGKIEALPRAPREALQHLVSTTAAGSNVTLNLAVNYSGRSEILEVMRALATEVRAGALAPESIDETTLESRLYTAGLPDPDLLIRPGGEHRISNFLLYQIAYTELWVSDVHWPEFDRSTLEAALVAYQQRQRRFGGA
jgi:undecaprenyl diphosphate synthase